MPFKIVTVLPKCGTILSEAGYMTLVANIAKPDHIAILPFFHFI